MASSSWQVAEPDLKEPEKEPYTPYRTLEGFPLRISRRVPLSYFKGFLKRAPLMGSFNGTLNPVEELSKDIWGQGSLELLSALLGFRVSGVGLSYRLGFGV